MNIHASRHVARFTSLELLRTRAVYLLLGVIVVASCSGEFAASIAITESSTYRLVFYSAIARLGAVLSIVLMVAATVLREFSDKSMVLTLSRPLTRADWYLGKLGAALFWCGVFAVFAALPLMIQTSLKALVWAYSLWLELAVVAAAGLAFAVSLRQLSVAVGAVVIFYLSARTIAAISLMSAGPAVDLSLASSKFIAGAVALIAAVLPDLDRFANSTWLVAATPDLAELGLLSADALIYVGLLSAVGLFDLYRRNFP